MGWRTLVVCGLLALALDAAVTDGYWRRELTVSARHTLRTAVAEVTRIINRYR